MDPKISERFPFLFLSSLSKKEIFLRKCSSTYMDNTFRLCFSVIKRNKGLPFPMYLQIEFPWLPGYLLLRDMSKSSLAIK